MGSYFSGERFLERIGQILPYLVVNLKMVFWSMLFGTILAIGLAILRLKKIPRYYCICMNPVQHSLLQYYQAK